MATIIKLLKPSDILHFQILYSQGKFPHMRFGQAATCHFHIENDKDLFYTQDRTHAQRILYDFYCGEGD